MGVLERRAMNREILLPVSLLLLSGGGLSLPQYFYLPTTSSSSFPVLRSPSSSSSLPYIPWSPTSSFSSSSSPALPSKTAHPSPSTSYISPTSYLSVSPLLPLASTRALCNSCSCSRDFGCKFNCDKCSALCKTCSCVTSLGCLYNCDKCQGSSSPSTGGGEPGSGLQFPLIPGGGASVGGAVIGGGGGLGGGGGAIGGEGGVVGGAVGGATSGEVVTEVVTGGGSGESSGSGGSGGQTAVDSTNCNVLISEFELCLWGPSCPTILALQFSHCNYDCATCTLLDGGDQEHQEEEEEPGLDQGGSLEEQHGDVGEEEQGEAEEEELKGEEEEGENENEDVEEQGQQEGEIGEEGGAEVVEEGNEEEEVEENDGSHDEEENLDQGEEEEEGEGEQNVDEETEEGGAEEENKDEKTEEEEEEEEEASGTSPPETAAAEYVPDPDDGNFAFEIDSADVWQLLESNQNTFDSNFGQIQGTRGETAAQSDSSSTSWTFVSDGPSCVALGGPGKGRKCRFPFIYQGKEYRGCAYKPSGSSAPVPPGSIGWCSTDRDINRFHINGPAGDPWRHVGFCDNSCPSA